MGLDYGVKKLGFVTILRAMLGHVWKFRDGLPVVKGLWKHKRPTEIKPEWKKKKSFEKESD